MEVVRNLILSHWKIRQWTIKETLFVSELKITVFLECIIMVDYQAVQKIKKIMKRLADAHTKPLQKFMLTNRFHLILEGVRNEQR